MPLACWASWPLIPAEKAGPAADDRKPAPSAAKQRAAAPARTACEADRKWVVEHHLDNHDIVLGDTNPRQTVYIFGCRNCTVQARPAAWGVAFGSPKRRMAPSAQCFNAQCALSDTAFASYVTTVESTVANAVIQTPV